MVTFIGKNSLGDVPPELQKLLVDEDVKAVIDREGIGDPFTESTLRGCATLRNPRFPLVGRSLKNETLST
jgi:hypothetical protein